MPKRTPSRSDRKHPKTRKAKSRRPAQPSESSIAELALAIALMQIAGRNVR